MSMIENVASATFPDILVTPYSVRHSIGNELSSQSSGVTASAVWPAANRAILLPLYFPVGGAIVKAFCVNGGTASGNIDLGLFDGSFNKLVSTGSFQMVGTNDVQEHALALTIPNNTMLYLGMAVDNGTAAFFRATFNGGAGAGRVAGLVQMAAAFALPTTIVPALITSNYMPLMGVSFRSLVQ